MILTSFEIFFLSLSLNTYYISCREALKHCTSTHCYHKNSICVYLHSRGTRLIESISFANDEFTFCHGGCPISTLWKYGFISWLISPASNSSPPAPLSSSPPSPLSFLSVHLADITTTSREMMVIGHFWLGQLLT